ncbi:hypothetical protein NUW54_g1777 [Trametes sanguinea]|uniref:Uncharacterized protein n=1 Tax=Trametes sanguinea TaxID=158606 RepID=A0ACC1Q970_9APHY|nr:hypothetical protein NUW54_g1777 [Trametes sanguinea]
MEFGSSSPTFPPPEPYELPLSYPRELVPIEEPIVSDLPTLPSPPRKSLLDQRFTASTHVIPVANPRTTPDIPLPTLPKWTANKEEFKASVAKTTDELLSIKEKQWRGELDHLPRGRKPMWNCINRYVRNSSGLAVDNGITLFFAHANGFPKEIWEPTLQRLVAEHEQHAGYTIGEIWLWEARNHGDAALINREQLDGICECQLGPCLNTRSSKRALQTIGEIIPETSSISSCITSPRARLRTYFRHICLACPIPKRYPV